MNTDQINLMIVDDVEDNRLVLRGICRKLEDVVISEAVNGEDALMKCDEIHPHIILMDMMMPVMDGFEATQRIKAKYPKTIIVIVTAVADPETEEKMIRCGATAYIRKPVDKDLVRFKLQNYIALLRVKSKTQDVFSHKKALNPFTQEIRSFKTLFHIEIADDMMDFGSWLTNWYEMKKGNSSVIFGTVVDFLYRIMKLSLAKSENLTVVTEEDFDHLYLTMIMDTAIVLSKEDEQFSTQARDNLIIKDNTLYLKLCIDNMYECLYGCKEASTETIKSVPLKEVQASIQNIRSISADEKYILRHSFVVKTSAQEYVADIGGEILEEIRDLSSLDDEWESYLGILAHDGSKEHLFQFIDRVLTPYAKVINTLIEFEAVSYSLLALGTFLKTNCDAIIENKKMDRLLLLLEGMGNELCAWKIHIFELQDVADIHYMDASFFSGCIQIEGLMSDTYIETAEDDTEFF